MMTSRPRSVAADPAQQLAVAADHGDDLRAVGTDHDGAGFAADLLGPDVARAVAEAIDFVVADERLAAGIANDDAAGLGDDGAAALLGLAPLAAEIVQRCAAPDAAPRRRRCQAPAAGGGAAGSGVVTVGAARRTHGAAVGGAFEARPVWRHAVVRRAGGAPGAALRSRRAAGGGGVRAAVAWRPCGLSGSGGVRARTPARLPACGPEAVVGRRRRRGALACCPGVPGGLPRSCCEVVRCAPALQPAAGVRRVAGGPAAVRRAGGGGAGRGGGAAARRRRCGGAGRRRRRRRRWRRRRSGCCGGAAAGGGGGVGRGGGAAGGGGAVDAAVRRGRRRWRWRRRRGRRAAAAGGGGAGGGGAAARPSAAALRFGFPSGPNSSLACATDERTGLRMRCGGCELHCRQSGRGEQHETKVCHDDLGSPEKSLQRKKLNCRRFGNDQQPTIRPDCGGLINAHSFLFRLRNGLRRDCSLRIQPHASNAVFTLSPAARSVAG